MTLKDADPISPSIFFNSDFLVQKIILECSVDDQHASIRTSKPPDRRSAIGMIGLRTEATSEHQTWAVVPSAPGLGVQAAFWT